MTNEKGIIKIFWTGGLDSTFRIVELSQRQCTVQPYYIVLKKKQSLGNELKAIETILRILRKDKRTKAKLLDPVIVDEEDIPRDTNTFDSWFRLIRWEGWQYYVLAKYANLHNIEVELGLQFSSSGVGELIDGALLIPHLDPDYDVLVLDKKQANQDTINVFGNFCFPKSLYHKTKREEVDILRKNGYGKIVKYTWSCFHPIMGYPCGHCGPCKSFEREGVRLPLIGKLLTATFRPLKKKAMKVIKLNYNYTIREVSEVYAAKAIDPKTGEVKKMFRLNETGVIILEAVQDGADIDEIARRLTDGFDVDYETAKSQASAFIAKLNL